MLRYDVRETSLCSRHVGSCARNVNVEQLCRVLYGMRGQSRSVNYVRYQASFMFCPSGQEWKQDTIHDRVSNHIIILLIFKQGVFILLGFHNLCKPYFVGIYYSSSSQFILQNFLIYSIDSQYIYEPVFLIFTPYCMIFYRYNSFPISWLRLWCNKLQPATYLQNLTFAACNPFQPRTLSTFHCQKRKY